MDKTIKTKSFAKVTELNGMPRFLEALPLAVQHVVAMIVGCVTPAIILAGVTGLGASEQIILIQSALLISGIATLLQLFPLGRFCGSGLPVIMGASFAYIPLLISLGSRFDLPTIFGAQLAGGLGAVAVGLFYKKLTKLFPPLVTGTVVFTIGLSLYPTAVSYMAAARALRISEVPETGWWPLSPWPLYCSLIILPKGSVNWLPSLWE